MDEEQEDSGHRQLLSIVARGTAIITEIYRLAELIPEPFKRQAAANGRVNSNNNIRQLDEIIFDFSYFSRAEELEARIEQSPALRQADELLCDTHDELLTRFFLAFESIHHYAADLNRFIADLEQDVYIGQTLETLIQEGETLQLLCEAYFQLGYLLLLADLTFEGGLRERLIVAHYRYSSYKSSPSTALDGTCNLLRQTQFRCERQQTHRWHQNSPVSYRPAGYPEKYFARAQVDANVVSTLIAKIQLVDIYNKTLVVFPQAEQRSCALAQQAAILYVLLYFCPNILRSQRSRMREITDKFFADNWILDLYLGERVNLLEAWEPYKAARESLVQILDAESVRELAVRISDKFVTLKHQIERQYLVEGWLSQKSLLEHSGRLVNCVREANVTLRWILLHAAQLTIGGQQHRLAKLLQTIVVTSMPSRGQLCEFLQNLALLEKRLGLELTGALQVRTVRAQEKKMCACDTLAELVAIFDDSKPMRWVQAGANQSLAKLLAGARVELESLDLLAGPREPLVRLINRIDTARAAYSDERSLQVVQLFADTKASLLTCLRCLDLEPKLALVLQAAGDFSYAWRLMDEFFTDQLQQTIKERPKAMAGLEALVAKLAAAFETQLVRIQQVGAGADLVSVSQYHSTKLVNYVRAVLQVIPHTILELIGAIIDIQTGNILGAMPSRIPLDQLRDYALVDQRVKMLELTAKISDYARGITSMPNATIGLVRLNSHQLLAEGMRRELARLLTATIQEAVQFSPEPQGASRAARELSLKLECLAARISGHKRSLEYVQDYLSLYGLRMWQEELARIIKSDHELALGSLLLESSEMEGLGNSARASQTSAQVSASNGHHQLQASFTVRLINQLLRATNPRETIYDEQTSAWYEQAGGHAHVLDARLFQLLLAALGPAGLNCVDKFCSSLLMVEFQRLDGLLMAATNKADPLNSKTLEALKFVRELSGRPKMQPTGRQLKQRPVPKLVAPLAEQLASHLLFVGQLEAIRLALNCALSTSCRYEARQLYGCLETLNTGLLAGLTHGRSSSTETPAAASATDNRDLLEHLEDSQVVFELTNHLEWIGLADPRSKIYTLALERETQDEQSVGLICLLLLDLSGRLSYSRSLAGFLAKQARGFYEAPPTSVDASPLFHGIAALLRHRQPRLVARAGHHEMARHAPFEQLLGAITGQLERHLGRPLDGRALKSHELTLELGNQLLMLLEFKRIMRHHQQRNSTLESAGQLPPRYLLDTFPFTLCAASSSPN